MKINSVLLVLFVVAASFLTITSCEKKGKCGESIISESGGDESHNFGMNCMTCHTDGGEGEGCFTVAGSASNSSLTLPLTSGSIRLYTLVNGGGVLKYTIDIDSKGNFHTTESIDYAGLYASVTGPNGTTKYMSSALSAGSCNSCHGVSTGKLWAD